MKKVSVPVLAVVAAAAIICTGGAYRGQSPPSSPVTFSLSFMSEVSGPPGSPSTWTATMLMSTAATTGSSTTGSTAQTTTGTTGAGGQSRHGTGATTGREPEDGAAPDPEGDAEQPMEPAGGSTAGGGIYLEVPVQTMGVSVPQVSNSSWTFRQIMAPTGSTGGTLTSVSACPISNNDTAVWSTNVGSWFTSLPFTFYIEQTSLAGMYNNQPVYESQVWSYSFNVTKMTCTAVSIDSRTMYGNPDVSGQPQGLNANALPHPVNFNNWIYQGGLFVGNSAPGVDQSKTARTQIYPPATTFMSPWGATLSMLNMGPSPVLGTAPTVSANCIPTSDPNYGVSPSAVTWSTAWNIGSSTGGANANMSQVATGTLANWFPIGGVTVGSNPNTAYNTSYNNISLSLANESQAISSNTPYWNYFESAAYQASQSTYPTVDGTPRLWVLDFTNNQTLPNYLLTYPSRSGP